MQINLTQIAFYYKITLIDLNISRTTLSIKQIFDNIDGVGGTETSKTIDGHIYKIKRVKVNNSIHV